MSEGGADIIIKGGSVKIFFEDGLYPKQGSDPKNHENKNVKIIQIRVLDGSNKELFNSGVNNGGLDWEIRVSTK